MSTSAEDSQHEDGKPSGEQGTSERPSEPSPGPAPDVTAPIEGLGGQTPPDPEMREALES